MNDTNKIIDASFGSNNDTVSVYADQSEVKISDGVTTSVVLDAGGAAVDPIEVKHVSINADGGHDIVDMRNATNDFPLLNEDAVAVNGGSGNDTIYGSTDDPSKDDLLIGGAGSDAIIGGDGFDTLVGGDDSDCLLGGGGEDCILGGSGADHLDAGANGDGTDTVYHNETVNPGDSDGFQDSLIVDENAPDTYFHNEASDNDLINP